MRHTMPRNKEDYLRSLENAFLAGCNWGYGVEHTVNIFEQEQVGADMYLGRISKEDAYQKLQRLREDRQ